MTISTDYFKNFLSILNLRFYTLLSACPADNRVEARDFMTRIADPSLEPDLEFSDAEVSATTSIEKSSPVLPVRVSASKEVQTTFTRLLASS